MNFSAVALFGSRARGEASDSSDVDILLITRERRARHAVMGNVSFFLYPWRHLQRQAEAGDLFVCHLAQESRPIYDPKKKIDVLRQTFRFKESYAQEIAQASDLGWFLLRHHRHLPGPLVTKRIAWCVRTILIARFSEERMPVFAAAQLAARCGSPEVDRLINQKGAAKPSADVLRAFHDFLRQFAHPAPAAALDAKSFHALFRRSKNEVALHTLNASVASNYAELTDPAQE